MGRAIETDPLRTLREDTRNEEPVPLHQTTHDAHVMQALIVPYYLTFSSRRGKSPIRWARRRGSAPMHL